MNLKYNFRGYKQTELVKQAFLRRLNDHSLTISPSNLHGQVSFNKQGPIHQITCQLGTKSGAKFQLETSGSNPTVCIEKIIYKLNSYLAMLNSQQLKRKAN